MKIGIMGGTFDPIHKGHLILAKAAYQEFQLNEVWFLPNGNPPHKTSQAPGASAAQRVAMIKQAIAETPYFKLEEYEVLRKEKSYSYKTMEHLKQVYPDHVFYFIIGADSLFSIEEWMRPERLLANCIILAACRGEFDTTAKMEKRITYLKQKYDARIEILPAPLMEISSQEVREALRCGESKLHSYLPEQTLNYIKTNHLYRGG